MGAIEDEAHTIPQIARRMGITRQGVQRVADELVREDLADLTDNPDHRRSPLLTLTAGGRRTLAQINRSQAAWSSEVAATFEYPDLEDAVRMLKAATRRLRDLEGWRGFKS
jgi:DNA-binding MarR family transcriptional regulator